MHGSFLDGVPSIKHEHGHHEGHGGPHEGHGGPASHDLEAAEHAHEGHGHEGGDGGDHAGHLDGLEAISANDSHKLIVMTYASHNTFKFCNLLHSCVQNDIHLRVLGWEPEEAKRKKGIGHKILAAQKALMEMNPKSVVLFVDAFDVIITRPADYILDEFVHMGSPLVFSGERGCWPYLDGKHQDGPDLCNNFYPDAPTKLEETKWQPYRFVNTGSWIALAKNALGLMNAIVTPGADPEAIGNANDQEFVTDLFVCDHLNYLLGKGQDVLEARVKMSKDEAFRRIQGCEPTGKVRFNIKLDYNTRLFQSLHNSFVDQSIWAHQVLDAHVAFNETMGSWQNIHTRSFPAIFHCNGGGKQHLEPVFAKAVKLGKVPLTEYDHYLQFDNHPETKFKDICPS
eukprot:gnl/Hemi2/18146_TR5993_c0_g1_i1.p1 gnl/Hemi2/18146_TR5993_c0_g1~~gnl/Hemi2/18146_TR5993_c0_g1_i1.p1  ORF type:complete len:445 (+),score=158.94 gnl/Hemi2/18146_TR5993_c0_g1_i1:143-1336(+)